MQSITAKSTGLTGTGDAYIPSQTHPALTGINHDAWAVLLSCGVCSAWVAGQQRVIDRLPFHYISRHVTGARLLYWISIGSDISETLGRSAILAIRFYGTGL
jgi:hypothetical protein